MSGVLVERGRQGCAACPARVIQYFRDGYSTPLLAERVIGSKHIHGDCAHGRLPFCEEVGQITRQRISFRDQLIMFDAEPLLDCAELVLGTQQCGVCGLNFQHFVQLVLFQSYQVFSKGGDIRLQFLQFFRSANRAPIQARFQLLDLNRLALGIVLGSSAITLREALCLLRIFNLRCSGDQFCIILERIPDDREPRFHLADAAIYLLKPEESECRAHNAFIIIYEDLIQPPASA